MTLKYLGDAIYKTNVADERPPTAISGAMLIETDTRKTFIYDGAVWNLSAGGVAEEGGTGAGVLTRGGIAPFTGNALTTVFTINHGMGSMPDVVSVEPASVDAMGDYVVTKNATTITITFQEPPPSPASGIDNVKFEWGCGLAGGSGGGTADLQSPYSWLIYKSGSNYKAKSGYLGTVPSLGGTNPNTSLDALWTSITNIANFNQSGVEANRGGDIVFDIGTFQFTDRALIGNMAGNNAGPRIRGQGQGTLLNFAPTTTKDAALKVVGQLYSSISDLHIAINDKVTNGIYLDGSTNSIAGMTIRNVRVYSTDTLRHTGQRGLYITTNGLVPPSGTISHFSVFDNLAFWWMDTAIETNVASPTNPNTSFINMNDIHMWECNKGIKIGDYCIETKIVNPTFQAGSYSTMEYGVLIGKFATNCQVVNMVADHLPEIDPPATDPIRAAVIINGGAQYNAIVAARNTSGVPTLDLSGNDTNTVTGNSAAIDKIGDYRTMESRWTGIGALASLAGGSGYFADLTHVGNSASTTTPTLDGRDGFGKQFVTTSTAGNQSGFITPTAIILPRHMPRLYVRFKLSEAATTAENLWMIFSTSATAPPTAGPGTGTSCFGLAVNQAVNNNFQCVHNDNAGAAQYANITKDDGTTPVPANQSTFRNNTTDGHELFICTTNYGLRWVIALDNYLPSYYTTDIPDISNAYLTFAIVVETRTSAAAALQLYDMKLSTRA